MKLSYAEKKKLKIRNICEAMRFCYNYSSDAPGFSADEIHPHILNSECKPYEIGKTRRIMDDLVWLHIVDSTRANKPVVVKKPNSAFIYTPSQSFRSEVDIQADGGEITDAVLLQVYETYQAKFPDTVLHRHVTHHHQQWTR